MLDVWDKFSKKITSTGVIKQEKNVLEKPLPCLTICPWKAFRVRGFHFTNQTYYDQTYNLSELVFQDTLANFSVQEINSVFLGRCFMFCYQQNVSGIGKASINLRKQMDLLGIYINYYYLI